MDASRASGGKGRLGSVEPRSNIGRTPFEPAVISSINSPNRWFRIYYSGPLQEVPYG
jgi:hypothetical protein